MYINYDLKSIFIHNPKCGGVEIREILLHYYHFYSITSNIHLNYSDFFEKEYPFLLDGGQPSFSIMKMGIYRYFQTHQDISNNILETYFKCTFVRNPYSKIYSAYCYLKRQLLNSNFKHITNIYENKDYFSSFETFIQNYKKVNKSSYFHTFITQVDQLKNLSGNININYIGKLENIENDFIEILTIMGIQDINHMDKVYNCNNQQNKTEVEETQNKIEEYTETAFLFVNEYFDIDFKTFQYEKYNTYLEFQEQYLYKSKTQHSNLVKKQQMVPYPDKIPEYFLKIPLFIQRTEENRIETKIPKNILQTYNTEWIHPNIYNNTMNIISKNKNYNYYFFTDESILSILQTHFDSNTLYAFSKIKNNTAKGYFIKYITLYVYGGIFIDLDSSIKSNFDHIIPENIQFACIYNVKKQQLNNWILIADTKNIIIKKIIDEMVKRILYGEHHFSLCVGSELMIDVVYNFIHNTELYNVTNILNENEIFHFFRTNTYFHCHQIHGMFIDNNQFIIDEFFHEYDPTMLYFNSHKYNKNILYQSIYFYKKKEHSITVFEYDNTKQDKYQENDYYKHFHLYRYSQHLKNNYNKKNIDLLNHLWEKMGDTLSIEMSVLKGIFDENRLNEKILEENIQNIEKYLLDEKYQIYKKNRIYIKCENCNFISNNNVSFFAHTYFCKK